MSISYNFPIVECKTLNECKTLTIINTTLKCLHLQNKTKFEYKNIARTRELKHPFRSAFRKN